MSDPWFTYFRGRGRMTLTPRNFKGWGALLFFLIVIIAPSLAMEWAITVSPWLLVAYFMLTLVMTVLFVRFAISRSERIDLDEITQHHAEFKQWRKNKKLK